MIKTKCLMLLIFLLNFTVPAFGAEPFIDSGVLINIENLQNLESFGKKYGSSYPVCVRLNPNMISEIESGKVTEPGFTSANKEHYDKVSDAQVSTWHNQSKFGIPLTQFNDIMRLVEQYDLYINGLHLHSSHVVQLQLQAKAGGSFDH